MLVSYTSETVPEMETTGTRGLLVKFLDPKGLKKPFETAYQSAFRRAELICPDGHLYGLNQFFCEYCGSSNVNRVYPIMEYWEEHRLVRKVGNPRIICGVDDREEYRDELLRKYRHLREGMLRKIDRELEDIRNQHLESLKGAKTGRYSEFDYPALPKSPSGIAGLRMKARQVEFLMKEHRYEAPNIDAAQELIENLNALGCGNLWSKPSELDKLCPQDGNRLGWGFRGSETTEFEQYNILFALDTVESQTRYLPKPSLIDAMLFIRSSSQELGILEDGVVREGRRIKYVKGENGAYKVVKAGEELLEEKSRRIEAEGVDREFLREFYIRRFLNIPQDSIKGRGLGRLWLPRKVVEDSWRQAHIEVHGHPVEDFRGF